MFQTNNFGVNVISDTYNERVDRGGNYNYVALDNNTQYKLKLSNYRDTDAMAEVSVEGDKVGTWFIPANDSITIERPSDVSRKFTFFKETDTRATNAGVIPGESTNGLIKVIFYPKKPMAYIMTPTYSTMRTSLPSSSTFLPLSPRRSLQSTYQESISPMTSKSLAPMTTQSLASGSLTTRSASAYSPKRVMSPRYQSGATVLGDVSSQRFNSMRRFSDNEIDWPNKTTITIRLIARTIKYNNESEYMYGLESSGYTGQYPYASGQYPYTSGQYPYTSIGNRLQSRVPPRIDEYF